jgi:hypothetical protein
MKKINRPLRALAAFALAFALVFTGFMPVWAADPSTGTPGTEQGNSVDATAAITKILRMPVGTAVPNVTFTFTAEKFGKGSDGNDIGAMPVLTIPGIEFTGSETGVTDTITNITTYAKQSTDFITGNAANLKDAGVGQYIYTITETAEATDTTRYDSVAGTHYVHESQSVYKISIYVEEDAYTTKYLAYVVAWRTTNDDGKGNVNNINDEKVDPTPGDPNGDPDNFSDMIFTNNFATADDNGDENDPANAILKISKRVVTAQDADKPGDTNYFPFRVTVTKADIVLDTPVPEVYRAYVVKTADGDAVDIDAAASTKDTNAYAATGASDGMTPKDGSATYDAKDYDYYDFETGKARIIYLKTGQSLVFSGTLAGTEWLAEELLSKNAAESMVTNDTDTYAAYTASATVTVNNETIFPDLAGYKGQDLSTWIPQGRFVGAKENGAAFVNHEGTVLPMGLDINNLPYYGLILLALLALAAYVAIRARRRNQDVYN